MCDRGFLRYVVNANVIGGGEKEVDNRLRPVCAVAQESEVTKRFLGAAKLALFLAQLVRELDKQLSVAVALMLRQCKNTRYIIVVR